MTNNRTNRTFKRANSRTKKLFWLLSCLTFVFSAAYVYFVNTAALHAVSRRDAELGLRLLSSEVADLETVYLTLKKSVTLALAYRSGFEDARAVTYVTAQRVGVVAKQRDI